MIKKFIYVTLSLAISTLPLMGSEQQQDHSTDNPIKRLADKNFWLPKEGKEQEAYDQDYKNLKPFHIRLYNDAQQVDFERALPTFFDNKGRPRIRIETLCAVGNLGFKAGSLLTQLLSPCLRELRIGNHLNYDNNIGLLEMSQLTNLSINKKSPEEVIKEDHWRLDSFSIAFLHVLGKTEADRQAAENILKEKSKDVQGRRFHSLMYLLARLNEKTKTEGLEFLGAFENHETYDRLSEYEKDAYYRLGNIYEKGTAIPQDLPRAVQKSSRPFLCFITFSTLLQ